VSPGGGRSDRETPLAAGGPGDAAALLTADGLNAGYGEALVLRDVSIRVRPGEIVAVVGPSGAGKTTLLRAIAGLTTLASGTIRLDGTRIDALAPHRRAALGVALMPEGRRLFGNLSVHENLELGAYLPRARAAAGTRALVERLFPVLRDRHASRADVLSGGEQQMVAVGRSLMAAPRLLVLDDPFLGLATAAVARLADALRGLVAPRDRAVLATGQHVRRLLRLADRAYLLEAGRVTATGTGRTLLADPRVRRALLWGS
jgi:branched-chain amino acid transport system ATP-binding protein